jgi:hypothetical protein
MSEQHNRAVVERLWQLFDACDFEAAGALLHVVRPSSFV